MGTVAIHLDEADGWAGGDGTYVRGSAFLDGERLGAAALADRLGCQETTAAVRETVASLNGFFAVVHRTDDGVVAAVDRHQTHPLFYGWDDETCHISDDADRIRDRLGPQSREPLAEAEFLLTGYVTGGETLYPDIRQLQAGELVTAGGADDIEPERYYRYQPDGDSDLDRDAILDRLDEELTAAFERLIEFADGRTIVVPLSGGHDSRLVVLMLDKMGYDDVLAFSYGKSWDPETKVSERIAEEIGVEWTQVEYTNDRWHDWFHSETREEYYDEAFNYGALPGLTNLAWPAVWELVRSGRVPEDAVFVPGHTAVSPSEHFPDEILEGHRIGEHRVTQFLKGANYKLWDWDDDAFDAVLDERIMREVETDEFAAPEDAARGSAEWYWQERQAKFINGDLQVYDFFDRDWWMPLWDNEFTEFWQSVPLELREDKAIYKEYVESLYADHTGVEIDKASETEMTSPIRRVHNWLYHSPVFDVVRPVYARLRYRGDPRAWPGVMPRSQFASLFTGRQRAYSFFGLEILDRMSFDPPHNIDTPTDGKLDVDVSEFETTTEGGNDGAEATPSEPARTSEALSGSPS